MPNNTETSPTTHEFPLYLLENVSDISLQKPIVNQPAPFTFPKHLTTPRTSSFHYITKLSKSTSMVSTAPSPTLRNSKSKNNHFENVPDDLNRKVITPTTYAPPVLFLKSFFDSKLAPNNVSLRSEPESSTYSEIETNTQPKSVKTYRVRVNPSTINNQLWTNSNETIIVNDYLQIKHQLENISDAFFDNNTLFNQPILSSTELFDENDTNESLNENDSLSVESSYETVSDASQSSTESFKRQKVDTTTAKSINLPTKRTLTRIPSDIYNADLFDFDVDLTNTSWLMLLERINNMNGNKSIPILKLSDDTLRESVIPKSLMDFLRYESKLSSLEKQVTPVSNPVVEDVTKKATVSSSRNTSLPTRVSRVNTAIKSVIALGGPQRQYTKCNDNQTPIAKCKKINQRYLFMVQIELQN